MTRTLLQPLCEALRDLGVHHFSLSRVGREWVVAMHAAGLPIVTVAGVTAEEAEVRAFGQLRTLRYGSYE